MKKKKDVKAVEELTLIPRQAGSTTEDAYRQSMKSSSTFKQDRADRKPRNPPKPRLVKKNLKKKHEDKKRKK